MDKRGIAFISIIVATVIIVGVVGFFFDESSVRFSPNQDNLGIGDTKEEWTRRIFLQSYPDGQEFVLILFRDVSYHVALIQASDNDATFRVRNLVTGESEQKEINEGQTKQILDLKVKVIEADENNFRHSALIDVTGKVIDYECVAPPEGLVSWWPFDQLGYYVEDIQDGNDGRFFGGVQISPEGKVGFAYEFNGEDGYVEVPDADNLDVTSITIDAWVKRQNSRNGDVLSKRNHLGGWLITLFGDGEVVCDAMTEGGQVSQAIREEHFLPLDEWSHIACTYDEVSGDMNLYVNGKLSNRYDRDRGENEPLRINNKSLLIGQDRYYYKGLIDEVQIFNRALSEEEIRSIFLAGVFGKCREGEGPMHAECGEGGICMQVEGEGSNECWDSGDCTHLACVGAVCQIVEGPGRDTCPRPNDPCIEEEFHYACLNGACQRVPGAGPDTCDQDTICPEFGNIDDGVV